MDVAALAQLGDCEAIHEGWLKQPANAWSSLAFSVVGVGIAAGAVSALGRERVDRIVFGSLVFATGIGSILFHGPQPGFARFLHDFTFLSALWYLGAANLTGANAVGRRQSVLVEATGIGVIALGLGIAPTAANTLAAALTAGLVISDVVLWQLASPSPWWYAAALVSLGVGAAMFLAGRTDSPWCDPAGLLQAHAAWHVLAAFFLGAYFFATVPARTKVEG